MLSPARYALHGSFFAYSDAVLNASARVSCPGAERTSRIASCPRRGASPLIDELTTAENDRQCDDPRERAERALRPARATSRVVPQTSGEANRSFGRLRNTAADVPSSRPSAKDRRPRRRHSNRRNYPAVVGTAESTSSDSTRAATRAVAPRRRLRLVGNLLLIIGLGVLVWAFVVWRWNDPLTSLYTRWQQHKLVAAHELIVERYRPTRPIPATATPRQQAATIAVSARRIGSGAQLEHRLDGSSSLASTSTCR